MSHILNIRGQVLPATLERVDLVAEMEDGGIVRGEEQLAKDPRRIKRVLLSEQPVPPYEKAFKEFRRAELIVLGPGSLFTSIIPNLLVDGVAGELERARGKKFYVVNLMTQPGETDGFTAKDHLEALRRYTDISQLDYVIVNTEPIPEHLLQQYEAEGSIPVVNDLTGLEGPEVIAEEFVGDSRAGGKADGKARLAEAGQADLEQAG